MQTQTAREAPGALKAFTVSAKVLRLLTVRDHLVTVLAHPHTLCKTLPAIREDLRGSRKSRVILYIIETHGLSVIFLPELCLIPTSSFKLATWKLCVLFNQSHVVSLRSLLLLYSCYPVLSCCNTNPFTWTMGPKINCRTVSHEVPSLLHAQSGWKSFFMLSGLIIFYQWGGPSRFTNWATFVKHISLLTRRCPNMVRQSP
jgi:hypothetical protein